MAPAQGNEPAFKVRVQRNIVTVRVVVRDSKGSAVTELREQNFKFFDNRTRQEISSFSVETSPTRTASPPQTLLSQPILSAPGAPQPEHVSAPG